MFGRHFAVLLAGASAFATAASASPFYDAAVCRPPYSMDSATTLYDAAEKLAKPDTSLLFANVYTLAQDLGEDGFRTRQVIFSSTSVGVLVEGLQADALAQRYHLAKEVSSLLGTSTNGYARALPADQQPMPELGVVSIIARESPALPGKTLLACEFVSAEDRKALDDYEKSRRP
jgi:hypothetical protein